MKALIFEDEAIIAESIRDLLRRQSIFTEVAVVNTLEKFEEIVSQKAFAIVFLDVNIRGKPDGITAGRIVRENFNLGLIYLTAYSSDEVIAELAANRPDGYLLKPFDETQLVAMTKQVLTKYKDPSPLGLITTSAENGQFRVPKIELYQNLLDRIFLISITDQTGIIVYANEAFSNISGYENVELTGSKHNIVNSGFHSKEFFFQMWDSILSGELWEGEVKNRKKDGSYYWVYSYVFALESHNASNTRYFVSVRTDITRRKEVEENLQEILDQKLSELSMSRQQLSLLWKDDSMVGFNSILVHEIKRPLSTLSMQMDVILRRYSESIPAAMAERLQLLRLSVAHTSKLIGYLNQTFRRKSDAKKEFVLLISMLQSVVDFTKLLFPYSKIDFKLNLPDFEIGILGYSDAIFLSFFNILKNACEAFPPEQETRGVAIDVSLLENLVEISFIDNKIGGIPKEIVEELFNPKTSQKEGGSGLGLHISRNILNSMDALIDLVHSNETGSCFKITMREPTVYQKTPAVGSK